MMWIWLILLLGLTAPAMAAPDCADPSPAVLRTDSPGTSESISYTTRSGSNQVTFLGVGGRRFTSAPAYSSVQIGGQTMTLIDTVLHSGAQSFAGIYYKVNPPAGTNNVTFSLTPAPTNADYVVWTCNDVDTSSPIRSSAENTGSDTTPTSTAPTVAATDTVIDWFATDYSGTTPSVGSNQTLISAGSTASSADGASYQSGANGGVMDWTIGSSDDWVSHAVALKAFPAGKYIRQPMVMQ